MNFRAALVFSVLLHIIVLLVVYYVPKPSPPERPEPYIVRVVSPEAVAPEHAAPPPLPEGVPVEPSPPVPHVEPSEPVFPLPVEPQVEPVQPAPLEPSPKPPIPETGHGPVSPPEPVEPSEPITPVGPSGPLLPPSGIPRPGDVQEIIDRIAKAPTPVEETESPGITFSTHEFRHRTYMQRLKEKIEGVWAYPREAADKGIYGDLYIRFTIKRDGSLGEIKVIRTSGYSDLDKAALKALREGAPYWPIPDGWPERSLTITGHFIYTLYGGYLR